MTQNPTRADLLRARSASAGKVEKTFETLLLDCASVGGHQFARRDPATWRASEISTFIAWTKANRLAQVKQVAALCAQTEKLDKDYKKACDDARRKELSR